MPATGRDFDKYIKSVRAKLTDNDRFTEKLLKALQGAKGLVEPSYVYLPGIPGGKEIAAKVGVDFFSVPIELGVRNLSPLN
jgi:hypothetical protein